MKNEEIEKAAMEYVNTLDECDLYADTITDGILNISDAFEEGVKWALKQNEWISVEERLPEFNRFMFLKYDDNHVEILEPCEKGNYPKLKELEIKIGSDNTLKVTHYKYINHD